MSTISVLCENIRRARLRQGLTQEIIAEKAGLSTRHFQDLETGRRPGMRVETIERIADVLRVEVWQLFKEGIFPEPEVQRGRSTKKIRR